MVARAGDLTSGWRVNKRRAASLIVEIPLGGWGAVRAWGRLDHRHDARADRIGQRRPGFDDQRQVLADVPPRGAECTGFLQRAASRPAPDPLLSRCHRYRLGGVTCRL